MQQRMFRASFILALATVLLVPACKGGDEQAADGNAAAPAAQSASAAKQPKQKNLKTLANSIGMEFVSLGPVRHTRQRVGVGAGSVRNVR